MNPLKLDIWGGWALSLDGAEYIAEQIKQHQPQTIAETGSGSSTLLLASLSNNVYSFEHTRKYYNNTKKLLDKHKQSVNLSLSELVETKHGWQYDTTPPNNIDLLLIDGPQGWFGRGGVLYQFMPYLSDNFVVLLDDANRPKEQAILKQWQKDFSVRVVQENERVAKVTHDG